ncbi:MAG: hypothetical protein K0R82_1209 [Flavipsychrobacter sp.]|jgi:hypothetical protein|nr:hypothetical protein [Flavipsychrobacter sp.]
MKNLLSFVACVLVALVLIGHRAVYPLHSDKPLKVTDWDALGYYMYLPALVIYDDITQLKWFDSVDRKYVVSAGGLYQANRTENGNYVCKYLGGVAILQAPFFFIAHAVAAPAGYPPDGFSSPYQAAIAYGVILYCVLSLFLLRRIMLRYFADTTVAIALILVCLATNFIQYAAIHNGMSHAFIFPLYALVLYTTVKWHSKPSAKWAAATGYIIGLAIICRPTEAVMLFIPLLWDTQDKQAAAEKWQKVRANKSHVGIAIFCGLLGVLPQLIYWKITSGAFIYDVGSSWRFLTPFFRVLFGWEKGWFIYTPVTLFFVLGLFYSKRYPFKNAALWFCLLNIYIIIAWADWRYGASYSTRALVQSYPVFALPFAAFVQRALQSKWHFAVYGLGLYFVALNVFQIWQYNEGILEGDLTRRYYSRVYFDRRTTPLDMSLLDTEEILDDERDYSKTILFDTSGINFGMRPGQQVELGRVSLQQRSLKDQWIRIDCLLNASLVQGAHLNAEMVGQQQVKETRIRLKNPIANPGRENLYSFYMKVPGNMKDSRLRVYLTSEQANSCEMHNLAITSFVK